MNLQYTPTLATDLKRSYLLLDTTVFIDASKSDDFLKLLTSISETGCSLMTIPPVVYEFSRNANNIDGYNERQDFINGLNVTVLKRIEDIIEKDHAFKIAYAKTFDQKKERGPSYTDALLCSVAYKYRSNGMLIMTANTKDIPRSMFDLKELITIDIDNNLRNEAIFKLSPEKLNRAMDSISR